VTKTGPAQLTVHRRSLDALTGIRFLAAVYVVIYHSKFGPRLADRGHWIIANFLSNGGQAVGLFFLLSGFILAYTYRGQITDKSSYRRFWEARFARIWPVYVVSLLLISLVDGFIPKISQMLAALFMVQSWDPFDFWLAGVWNVVCWTLSCEAFFYLVFPFFQARVEKLTGRFQILVLAVLFSITISLNLTRNGVFWMETFNVQWVPIAVQRLPEFLAGVTLGNLFYWTSLHARERNNGLEPRMSGGWLTYVATFVGIVLLCHATWRWSSLIVLPWSLLIFGLAVEKTPISDLLSTRMMIFGGAISYSMYLLQTSVKDIAKWIGPRIHVHSESALSVLMFILLVLISAASYEGIEKPARDLIRSFFAKRERRGVGTASQ
jgi:peptidoglycan/LPS O-acetylase OafA/YrhL